MGGRDPGSMAVSDAALDATIVKQPMELCPSTTRTTAQNLGDWYDVDAVIALVNTVLRDKGASGRVAVTSMRGNEGEVVVGPGAAIGSLVKSGDLALVLNGTDSVADAIRAEKKAIEDEGGTPLPGNGYDRVDGGQ